MSQKGHERPLWHARPDVRSTRQRRRRLQSRLKATADTDLRHPFCAREMRVVGPLRPIGLPLGVNVPDDPRDLAPVGAVRIGIEHTEIGD